VGAVSKGLSFIGWNIENLVPTLDLATSRRRGRTRALAEALLDFGEPDVLCLQEIRVRPADLREQEAMRAALPGYACHAALARDPRNVTFRGGKAYGVAIYVRESLTHVALPPPEWDREGRVIAIDLPELGLLVASVYAVNGTDKPYFDHDLGRIEGDRHAFKRRFQASLLGYLRSVSAVGRQLVLLGDWNVSRTAQDTHPRLRTEGPHALARAMFNETFMPGLDVVDAFRELHPDARAYTWFNRLTPPGRLDAARVDFALVSRTLLPRVREASILDEPTQRVPSDHAPVRLVLDPAGA
jgi:exodeoxyribonuclease III